MTDLITPSYQWRRNGAVITGASKPSYTVQVADLGTHLSCTITETNAAGSTTVTTATTAAVAAPTGIPAAPSGPQRPPAGYRVVLADDFIGSSLDTRIWMPSQDGEEVSGPNNSWEAENYTMANVTVSDSVCRLTCIPQTTTYDGVTRYYTSGTINTGVSPSPFLFSPYHGGTFYIEARIKGPGDATGTEGSLFTAFWATTYRTYGLSANDNLWTREMDFFEIGGRQGDAYGDSNLLDGTQIGPVGGYGNGSMGTLEEQTALIFDTAAEFHLYTVQINTDGSYTLWIDGQVQWSMSAFPAIDWMGLVLNYGMSPRAPTAGFTSDAYLIDYVAVWQDASVPEGQGVMGQAVASGTVL